MPGTPQFLILILLLLLILIPCRQIGWEIEIKKKIKIKSQGKDTLPLVLPIDFRGFSVPPGAALV